MASVLRGTIDFLKDFGLFDVILPFLLIFAIVFAILEKTMILGKEKDDPKQNLNSIVALVIALLFISANKAVNLITDALPNIALLMVIIISFLLMIGVFWKSGEFDFTDKHKKWYIFFTFIIFIALVLIFLGAYEYSAGVSLLSHLLGSVGTGIGDDVLTGGIVLVVIVGVILWIVKKPAG
ncbi:hypothetical protein K8R33_02000, partial [archaeon]|nr:hypothetical protein [archaeon]